MKSSIYFRGNPGDMGAVGLVEGVGDFGTLLTDVLLVGGGGIGVSREGYANADREERGKLKRVGFLIAGRVGGRRRVKRDLVGVSLLFVDVDDSDAAREAMGALGRLDAGGVSWCGWFTASSTVEAPRVRVVVPCGGDAGFSVADHRRGVDWLAGILGIVGRIDACSYDPVLPMYLPCRFEDDPEGWLPTVGFGVGRDLAVGDLEAGRTLAGGSPDVVAGFPATVESGDIGNLVGTLPFLSIGEAGDLLGHLDADMDRDRWLRVAAGVKHQFGGTEEAFGLFHSWSATGRVRYVDEAACRRDWDSLVSMPVDRVPATFRTILRYCEESGWSRHGALVSRMTSDVHAWVCGLVEEDKERFMGLAVGALARLHDLGPLVAEESAQLLRGEMRRRWDDKSTIGVYRKLLKAAVREMRGKGELTVPEWLRPWVYVMDGGEWFDTVRRLAVRREAFDTLNAQFCAGVPSAVACGKGGEPALVPILSRFVWEPPSVLPAGIVGDAYNTWVDNGAVAGEEGSLEAGALLLRHLEMLVGDAYAGLVLSWMAAGVRGLHIGWAPLIQGVDGCGKTLLGEILMAVVGADKCVTIGSDTLTDRYNDWIWQRSFVFAEEIFVGGMQATATMDKLKPLISNKVVAFRALGKAHRMISNHANFLLFTNRLNAIKISAGDRRYMYIESPMQERRDLPSRNHFTKVWELAGSLAGPLRWFFEEVWEFSSGFEVGVVPDTEFREELVGESLPGMAKRILGMIEGAEDWRYNGHYIIYQALVSELKVGHVATTHLRVLGYKGVPQRRLGGRRINVWMHSGQCGKDSVPMDWNGFTELFYNRYGGTDEVLDRFAAFFS